MNKITRNEIENRKKISIEMAKYFLDLSKLVFAGIIVTEIIDFNINKLLLFSVGLIFISLLTFLAYKLFKYGYSKRK